MVSNNGQNENGKQGLTTTIAPVTTTTTTTRTSGSRRNPRPQFHYFYGSTTSPSTPGFSNPNNNTSNNNTGDEGESIQNEQDSLVGEELISTDNEGEQDLLLPSLNGEIKRDTKGPGQPTPTATTASSYGICSIVIFLSLAGGIGTLLVWLIPHNSDPLPQAQTFTMPFPQVDRAQFGDPIEDFIDMDLFHPNLIAPPETPHSFVFPFPTGAFWTNLVVQSPQNDPTSYPIVVYPYAYRWSESTLQVSYPAGHRVIDEHTIQDTFAPDLKISTQEGISNRYITQFDPLSVTLRYVNSTDSKWETALVQGSPYVTIQYMKATPVFQPLSIFSNVQCPGDADENFSDMMDENADTEKISGGGGGGFQHRRRLFGVCSINDSDQQYTTIRGVQFIFRTPEGVSWIMFSSEPMNLVYDKIRKTTVTSAATYTGIIRLAYIPNDKNDEKTFDSSTGLRRLIYHSAIYPVGGQVSYEFHGPDASISPPTIASSSTTSNPGDTSRHATVTFSFATRSMMASELNTGTTHNLLMLALPHHAELFSDSVKLNRKKFDLKYKCIKGNMTPIIGATWTYEEQLYDMEFDAPFQAVDENLHDLILKQIEDDLTRVLPTFSENVYGYGKQVARLAQLAHIAYRIEGASDKKSNVTDTHTVLGKASEQLSKYLESYLNSDVSDGLVFDTKMGGLVSTNGLHDKREDFGNGRYNDHHFHYGYFLYAAAVMAKIDPSFIQRFGSHVDAIFHDVAHATNGDSRIVRSDNIFFPMTRHKSWFDGHSFATGMFPFGNGKSQESSSEAVNCYYGAYLWSSIRHEGVASDLTDFSRLLLAMEIRGAKTYWQMVPPTALGNNSTGGSGSEKFLHLYPAEFEENYMIGNVGMLDVAANTWFGTDPLYIHMINAIPITAVTMLLFTKEYVKYEYPFLMKTRDSVEMAWRGYTTSIHAIIDPNKAWQEAQDLVSYELDAALSKSQVMYFISQQPGFDLFSNATDSGKGRSKGSASKSSESTKRTENAKASSRPLSSSPSTCENHPKCVANGLSGECCPTSENMYLDCCSR